LRGRDKSAAAAAYTERFLSSLMGLISIFLRPMMPGARLDCALEQVQFR